MAVDKQAILNQLAKINGRLLWPGFLQGAQTQRACGILHEVMNPGEQICAATSGTHKDVLWLVVVTDRRLLLLHKGVLWGKQQFDLPLSEIQGVENQSGLVLGEISVTTAGAAVGITGIPKRDLAPVVQTISELLRWGRSNIQKGSAVKQESGVVSELERLAALKEKRILSEDEFQTQKRKLLGA